MRKLDSRTRSCSELEKGSRGTLAVKEEGEQEVDLKKRIKDRTTLHVDSNLPFFVVFTLLFKTHCLLNAFCHPIQEYERQIANLKAMGEAASSAVSWLWFLFNASIDCCLDVGICGHVALYIRMHVIQGQVCRYCRR